MRRALWCLAIALALSGLGPACRYHARPDLNDEAPECRATCARVHERCVAGGEAKKFGLPGITYDLCRREQEACVERCGQNTGQLTAPREVRRSMVMRGQVRGGGVTIHHPDGSVSFEYSYLNSGRGPRLRGTARLSPDGLITRFDATGHNFLGTPFDEHFAMEGSGATWSGDAEKGSAADATGALYIPRAEWPGFGELLLGALQRSGGRLRLLPGGEARLERVTEAIARNGRGEEKTLIGWAVVGLGFTPLRLWSIKGGGFFGVTDDRVSFVPEGWEDALEPLQRLNRTLDDAWQKQLVSRTAQRPPESGLAVVHARVLDVEAGRWLEDHTVLVREGRITALGPSASVRPQEGARIIDGTGLALLPGLWDMHAHLSPEDGPLNIAAGVTTARDLGNEPDLIDALKQRFDEGDAVGPHVLRSGFIEGRGEYAASARIVADDEAEAERAVAFYAERGYEGIKIYNSVKPALVATIARLAHARGLRVSGHVPTGLLAEDALAAGYDELQHINMVFLNFLATRETETRTTQRFTLVAEGAAGLDLDSEPVRRFIGELRRRGTVVDPTASVFEFLFLAQNGKLAPGADAYVARLPVQVARVYREPALPVPEGKGETYRRSFDAVLELIGRLHRAGVHLVAGTDGFSGLGLHRELQLYADAGIPVADVLRIATLGSARVMKRDGASGSITVGKDADFFLVEGDPLTDLGALSTVRHTIKAGVVYDARKLMGELGISP